MRAFVAILLLAAWAPSNAEAAALKAVAFDIEPVDLPPSLAARLPAESDLLRKTLADKGLAVVDTTPQSAKIVRNLPLSQCNGCDQDIAHALGADIEVATAIQKVGSSIYNITGSVKDVATSRVLRSGVVSVNGDGTDEWNHGIRFLAKERLLTPPLPADAAALKALVTAAPKPAD